MAGKRVKEEDKEIQRVKVRKKKLEKQSLFVCVRTYNENNSSEI